MPSTRSLIVEVANGRVEHPLHDGNAACEIVGRLAKVIPKTGTWYVSPNPSKVEPVPDTIQEAQAQ